MFCVSTLGRGVECCFVLRASVLFECKFSVLAPFCVVRRGDVVASYHMYGYCPCGANFAESVGHDPLQSSICTGPLSVCHLASATAGASLASTSLPGAPPVVGAAAAALSRWRSSRSSLAFASRCFWRCFWVSSHVMALVRIFPGVEGRNSPRELSAGLLRAVPAKVPGPLLRPTAGGSLKNPLDARDTMASPRPLMYGVLVRPILVGIPFTVTMGLNGSAQYLHSNGDTQVSELGGGTRRALHPCRTHLDALSLGVATAPTS